MNNNVPTMCDLAEQKEFDKMHKLSTDAKWFCKGCGRVANEKDRLCEPIDLYPDTEQVRNQCSLINNSTFEVDCTRTSS